MSGVGQEFRCCIESSFRLRERNRAGEGAKQMDLGASSFQGLNLREMSINLHT